MQREEIWLRLKMVTGLRMRLRCQMANYLTTCSAINTSELQHCGMTPSQADAFLHPNPAHIHATLQWLTLPGNHMLTLTDAAYPFLLQHIPSPPLVLFVTGDPTVLLMPQIALVGSRQHTHYGEQWGKYFAAGLTHCGYAITSGLALGIDGICHQAALDASGKTIAVLGCGLSNIYPARHKSLARQIVASGGALVSEFLCSELPIPAHFPRRNRIISGLSSGVLVVEATLRSGSLITARCALEQGRDVFALPGPLGSSVSQGTHWLIQQGAYLVTEPKDIAEQIGSGLQWLPDIPAKGLAINKQKEAINQPKEKIAPRATTISTPVISIPDHEVELPFPEVLANVGYEVTPIDVVARRSSQSVPEIVMKLLELELTGWVAAVSGGYVRVK